jgi:hypothetical protein
MTDRQNRLALISIANHLNSSLERHATASAGGLVDLREILNALLCNRIGDMGDVPTDNVDPSGHDE